MKKMKRAASLFLAVLMLMSVMIPGVSAAEPTDLPASDSPMLYNTTDSSKFPKETSNLTDVYGQIDTEAANEMDSMFSDEAWARFADDMDRMLDFEPVEDKEAAPVLKSADHFVADGGLQAYLKGGSCIAAYNPDDVTSIWLKTETETGYEEFRLIETAYDGKTLEQVNESRKNKMAIVRNEYEEALQAKIRLAAFIETAAEQAAPTGNADIKRIRETRQTERRKKHKNIGEVISNG